MIVLLVSGKARNGKDTVASMLEKKLVGEGHSVLVAHYADLLKYICRTFFGWDGKKDESGRELLQWVGTDVVRKRNPDFWVEFILNILSLFEGSWDYVIIPDTRFPNEIEAIRNAGYETYHLSVSRPSFDNGLTEEQKLHPSETALDDVSPDFQILNDGTLEDLNNKVEGLLQNILSKETP